MLHALRFQARGRILAKPTDVPLGQRSRVRAHLHVHSSSRVAYANPPDWPEMLVWRRRLRPGDLFLDVGANIGVYTVWAAELGAKVVAVEPSAAARAHLHENLALNGYEAEVLSCALGADAGWSRFTTTLGTQNHLLRDGGDQRVSSNGEEVEVRTLDQLLGDQVAGGVKIDVEGAESLVLQGGQRALSEHRIRLLQLEWNEASIRNFGEDRTSALELLKSTGYEPYRSDDQGALVRMDSAPMGQDLFFCPQGDA